MKYKMQTILKYVIKRVNNNKRCNTDLINNMQIIIYVSISKCVDFCA